MVSGSRHRDDHRLPALHREPATRSRRVGRSHRDHHRRRRGDLRTGQSLECAHRRGPLDCSGTNRPAGCAVRWTPRRASRRSTSTSRSAMAGGARSSTRCARCWAKSSPTARPPRTHRRRHRGCHLRKPLHLRAARPGPGDPDLGGATPLRLSCCGRARIRRCGSPKRTGPRSAASTSFARCATTAPAAPQIRQVTTRCTSLTSSVCGRMRRTPPPPAWIRSRGKRGNGWSPTCRSATLHNWQNAAARLVAADLRGRVPVPSD